jgi:cell wall-associated NlpC family hydrolase
MNAIVIAMIANLHAKPDSASELIDEVLYGMPVQVIEELENDWVRIQTAYRYGGYCEKRNLLIDDKKTSTWLLKAQHVINQRFADVLQAPKIQSSIIMTLVKGSIVHVVSDETLSKEWAAIQLATGEIGYLRQQWLHQKVAENSLAEPVFRENVVQTALSYIATPYRWGGKSPLGIDCSGLCSIAYMLNGVTIFRDAKIVEGFPIKEITFERMQKGDLLFFPGHVAMYIGQTLYVHSSLGGNEVNINSLDEQHVLYRKDLATTITAVGSLFYKEL